MSHAVKPARSRGEKQARPAPATAPPVASPAPAADVPAAPAAGEPVYAGDRYALLFWFACAGLLILMNVLDAFYHVLHR